ncbi:hypothetical protein AYI69_g5526 [Smittium culicis]|uniref:Uncharacterized protein n=1 Tax=Smittium culicis TaxID=133412 RepID=A0A1R1Y5M8_9FUNG|nr:hypothetical protein AYI69_g5526 [Smittium culicis]
MTRMSKLRNRCHLEVSVNYEDEDFDILEKIFSDGKNTMVALGVSNEAVNEATEDDRVGRVAEIRVGRDVVGATVDDETYKLQPT